MKNATLEVQEWLKTKDFDKGIVILSKHRAPMARILRLRGPRHVSKLEYELKKIGGLKKIEATVKPSTTTKVDQKQHSKPPLVEKKQIATKKDIPSKTHKHDLTGNIPVLKKTESTAPTAKVVESKQVDLSSAHGTLDHIPPQIEAVAKEHARLFMLRSQLADQRYELPRKNDKDTVKQRKVLTESIHELSGKIEILFHAHSDYMKNRIMPDMSKLFPSEHKEDQPPPANETDASIRDLKQQRTSLMSANRRDRLILNYGQAKQLKHKNPLPDGPERERIEMRVLNRQNKIDQIEKQIKQLKS